MNLRDKLQKYGLQGLKISVPFLEAEWKPNDDDQQAAWELYIELLTRIATQPLRDQEGKEDTALASIFSLFAITREILRAKGRKCVEFTKVAIVVLNQVVRPFTAKWHPLSESEAFKDSVKRSEFRIELKALQIQLRNYTQLLAELAGVEDLTNLGDG